jgi:putative ABC transport system permease protein
MVLQLAVRNLTRHRGRTLVVGLGATIGVAASVVLGALVAGIRHQMIDHMIVARHGHLMVLPGAGDGGATGGPRFLDDPLRVSTAIEELIDGAEVAPFLSSLGMAFGDGTATTRVALTAIDPDHEPLLMADLRGRFERNAESLRRGTVWLGAALGERLACRRGDVVSIAALDADGVLDVEDYEVAEVLLAGAPWEDHFVYMRLEDLQRLLRIGDSAESLKVWLGSARGLDDRALERARRSLEQSLPATRVDTWRETGRMFLDIVRAVRAQGLAVEVVLLLAVALTVAGAQIVSVHERRREVGTMKALGTTRGTISAIILAEGAVLALAAGLSGIAVGAIVTALLRATGLALDAEAFRWLVGANEVVPQVELGTVARTLLVLIGTVTLAGWFPSWRAASLLPVEALRAGPP